MKKSPESLYNNLIISVKVVLNKKKASEEQLLKIAVSGGMFSWKSDLFSRILRNIFSRCSFMKNPT